jgi:hypothetical protein
VVNVIVLLLLLLLLLLLFGINNLSLSWRFPSSLFFVFRSFCGAQHHSDVVDRYFIGLIIGVNTTKFQSWQGLCMAHRYVSMYNMYTSYKNMLATKLFFISMR